MTTSDYSHQSSDLDEFIGGYKAPGIRADKINEFKQSRQGQERHRDNQ